MANKYTAIEVSAIDTLIQKYGHLTYVKTSVLEEEYYKLSGVHRVSGALYMAAWRLENGYYDHLLPVTQQDVFALIVTHKSWSVVAGNNCTPFIIE